MSLEQIWREEFGFRHDLALPEKISQGQGIHAK